MCLFFLILVALLDLLDLQRTNGDGKILLTYNIGLILLSVLPSMDMVSGLVVNDLNILVNSDGHLLRF